MACVDLPAFPLQLLLRRRPDWRLHPAAVVEADRPQARILWVNERARAAHILPGMRYAAGLALARELRAGEVTRSEIDEAVTGLVRGLVRYTPNVEPAAGEPGVFWLDASGLERLHDTLRRWADLVRNGLRHAGWNAAVAVGFTRFGTYALARGKRGAIVIERSEDERRAARRVPLDRLGLDPAVRDALTELGLATAGELADLPEEGVARRFGEATASVHRLARDTLHVPLTPARPRGPVVRRRRLDHVETDAGRIVHLVERLLGPLLTALAERDEALRELSLGLCFERLGDHVERLRPAAPTLDRRQLVELVRLRLQAAKKLPDGVVEVVLVGEGTPATRRQLDLFAARPRRDPEAAERALARVRAELGERAVRRARTEEGHLPEASFAWEPCETLPRPQPREHAGSILVRRMYERPVPLPPRPRQEPDGWILRGLEHGPVVRVSGPYVVSGGWWKRSVHREYHFAETQRGELLWVFYDRMRRRWYLQGRVE